MASITWRKTQKYIILTILTSCLIFQYTSGAEACIKSLGSLYIKVTNPMEWILGLPSGNTMVEQQHISPQFMHSSLLTKTILISRINHTVSDRWRDKPFLVTFSDPLLSILTFGSDSAQERLNAAYRTGCYAYPYAFWTYKYEKDNSCLLALDFDASTMALYTFAWAINIPQKLWNKAKYIYEMRSQGGTNKVQLLLLCDLIPNILSLIVELIFVCLNLTIGLMLGILFHPIDTVCSFGGALLYFAPLSVWTAISALF